MEWSGIFHDTTTKHDSRAVHDLLEKEYTTQIVYLNRENIYQIFDLTPFEDIKVVTLGQDPYHGSNQTHGLVFSVQLNTKFPSSLRDMYQELEDDIGCHRASSYLQDWAHEDVLLLNTVLTVRKGEAHSHKNIGWELFTDEVVKVTLDYREDVVFILWGKPVQRKIKLIDIAKHHIIKSVHPSPLSAYRGSSGSKLYPRTNDYLKSKGKTSMQRYENGES